MSSTLQPSAVSNMWSAAGQASAPGPSMTGPFPQSGAMGNSGNIQSPGAFFPQAQQPIAPAFSAYSNNYASPNGAPSINPSSANFVQNATQSIQNEANNRRLTQLEDEDAQRRNATMTLQQMGTQLLQGQMDVQEQVLQYQFMLEQCLETLDHQNFIINGQAEELALLRAKMKHYEYIMDAIKQSIKGNQYHKDPLQNLNINDFKIFNYRNPFSFNAPPGSPFPVARVTSSKFQPHNSRYRSSMGRSSNSNFNEPQNITSSVAY